MNIEQFAKLTKGEIDAFEAYWQKRSKEEPEIFPNELDEGDWWEQFIAWQDMI